MAGSRQTNTFGEQLQKMLRDLADMKVSPDADLPFIVDLETQVIAKLRQGIDGAESQGLTQVPGDPGLGMAIGGGGGMPMGVPTPGPGIPGLRSAPQIPAPAMDELRRMIAS